jgi:hypothetical protein
MINKMIDLFKKEAEGIASALKKQRGGDHYKKYKIQPIEFIHANDIPFMEGNVIKYICRHREKNGLEDLLKAKHYIDLIIELNYQNQIEK